MPLIAKLVVPYCSSELRGEINICHLITQACIDSSARAISILAFFLFFGSLCSGSHVVMNSFPGALSVATWGSILCDFGRRVAFQVLHVSQ